MQDSPLYLSDEEVELYARQLVLQGWDEEVQSNLRSAHIALIGVGGLGMPVLSYLAGAGIGHITLIEPDLVDRTNLHRQHMPTLQDVGRSKIDSAKDFIEARFAQCKLTCHQTELTDDNASLLLDGCSMIVDCTDRLETRLMIARLSQARRIPHIFAGAIRHEGQISVFVPSTPDADMSQPDTSGSDKASVTHTAHPDNPCFGCIFPDAPEFAQAPSCAQAGILGPVVGMVGAMQANEVLKLLTGIGTPLIGKLLLIDAALPRFDEIKISRQAHCSICGPKNSGG